ncbi:energy-coupling factor ABC transporter permease [Gorillibacterium sp. sgz5001074]|uniref:energy-coupling factor ABC transporter permease n=1 Tax=Gorillibacterium sp. sgz5001074 TaxID=3446695 RepID=UPI003F6720A8
MHIPDGFLDPKTWITLSVVSAAGIGTALRKIRRDEDYTAKVPMIGMVSAFIFASQMINFPVAGGTSGHLGGAALASILFGPWVGMLVMATVVTIQALIFQDGGITALGANIFNMGLIASLTGYGVYRLFGISRHKLVRTVGSFAAAWLAVEASAAAAALELAVSGTVGLSVALKAMLGWHALIGLGEGIITVGVVTYFRERRSSTLLVPSGKEAQG